MTRGVPSSETREGWWYHASQEEKLAQIDAAISLGLTSVHVARNCMDGQVCAIGSVGRARGVDMSKIDAEDYSKVAAVFGINEKLAQEIVWMNDDAGSWKETPEQRFVRMRNWVTRNLKGSA